jgi:hypothetical protein
LGARVKVSAGASITVAVLSTAVVSDFLLQDGTIAGKKQDKSRQMYNSFDKDFAMFINFLGKKI